jgi:hypothetical protein
VTDDRRRTEGRWNVAEVMIDMTGLGTVRADVPLLNRVLTGLRGDMNASVVPEGYLSGGGGGRLRRRPGWRFEQPPDEFAVALARLRRLTVVCPGAEVRQHTEVPSQWVGTVPGVCDGDRPVLVTGLTLGELAVAMELAVERRASLRAALEAIRGSWEDYQIWYSDQRWWALRRDGQGEPLCAPEPDRLHKLLAGDAVFCPVRP